MSARSYLSIGDVLTLLRQEFPDVTISKIRFLESQGLVNPERTPSGYRKFYEHDVERLRWVLRQQRENFLPLKVIKDRLDDGQEGDGGDIDATAGTEGAGVEPVLVGQRSSSGGHAHAASAGSLVGVPTGVTHSPGSPSPSASVPTHVEGTTLPGIESPGADANGSSTPAEPAPVGSGPGGEAAVVSGRAVDEAPAADGAPGAPGPVVPATSATAEPPVRSESRSAPVGPDPTGGVAGSIRPVAAPGRTGSVAAGSGGGPKGRAPAEVRPGSGAPDGRGTEGPGGRPAAGSPATGRRNPPPAPSPAPPAKTATPPAPAIPTALGAPARRSEVSLTIDELASASGLEVAVLEELVEYGLMSGTRVGGLPCFDDEALAVATLAAGFARFGIEPRHLRLYKNAADREAGFVEQIVLPLVRQRNPEARVRANETADELAHLGQQLRASLLRTALSDLLDG